MFSWVMLGFLKMADYKQIAHQALTLSINPGLSSDFRFIIRIRCFEQLTMNLAYCMNSNCAAMIRWIICPCCA